MATLENFNGASLQPDLSPSLNALGNIFGTPEIRGQRSRNKQNIADFEANIDAAVAGDTKALARIAAINPQAGKVINDVLARGDAQEIADMKQKSDESVKRAAFVKGIADPKLRQQELIRVAQGQRDSGDIDGAEETLRIANMPIDQQNLELERKIVMGTDVKKITDRFLAPKQKAQSEVGKLSQDHANGIISDEDFQRAMEDKLRDPNSAEAFKIELAQDKQRILQEQDLKKNDPEVQLRLQQLAQNVEAKKQEVLDSEEQKKKAQGLKADVSRLVNELLANEEGVREFVGPFDQLTGDFTFEIGSNKDGNSLIARTKIKQLQNILTADNMDLMTGVLSESDIKILAGIAGGGLDVAGDEDAFIDELRRMQKATDTPANASAPGTPQKIGRFTVTAQ